MPESINLEMMFQQDEFDKAMNLLSFWDFSLTKQKLLEPDYAGWTEERIIQAEIDYKRYMAVTKALNGYQLVPNGDIDRFWHEHILDTRRYAKDCSDLFGGFLHHYPFFGMQGESDNKNWLDTINLSTNFWKSLFKDDLYKAQNLDAQKCPQACPSGIDVIQIDAQKCPQACPSGISSNIEPIDKDYQYLPSNIKKKAA